jgi:type I restriction enzyme S subunit
MALGDALSALIDHRGKTPKKLGGDWVESGHRVVSAINIKDNRVDDNDHHYVDDELYARWMKTPLKAGDVLLTSEAPTGEVAYLGADADWCLGQRLFGLRGNPNLLVGRYLYYLLRGGPVRHQLLSRATGTTVSGIRQSELVKVELDLPSIDEQRAVASVLGALDDKIESNRKIASRIEELLRAGFQRVVTAPDVVRVPLADLAMVTKGVSYKSADLMPSQTSLVTLKSFDRNGGYKREGLKQYVGPYKPQQVITPGEVAVALTDLTRGAEVVGRAVRVPADAFADVLVASLDVAIVRPVGEMSLEYLWRLLADDQFREHCRARTSGTTVLHLGGDAVPTYLAPVATVSRQEEFTDFARPLIERMDSVGRESDKLAALRDTLLPELLTGRVRIAETGTSGVAS